MVLLACYQFLAAELLLCFKWWSVCMFVCVCVCVCACVYACMCGCTQVLKVHLWKKPGRARGERMWKWDEDNYLNYLDDNYLNYLFVYFEYSFLSHVSKNFFIVMLWILMNNKDLKNKKIGDSVAFGIVPPSPLPPPPPPHTHTHTSWDLSTCQHHFRDNSALNMSNEWADVVESVISREWSADCEWEGRS